MTPRTEDEAIEAPSPMGWWPRVRSPRTRKRGDCMGTLPPQAKRLRAEEKKVTIKTFVGFQLKAKGRILQHWSGKAGLSGGPENR